MTDTESYDKELRTAWLEEVGKFDRAVLTLASAALSISVAFIRNVGGNSPRHQPLLGVGWVLLLASLFLIVASFTISKQAIEARLDRKQEIGNKLSKKAWTWSVRSGWLLAIGTFAVVLFAWLNL